LQHSSIGSAGSKKTRVWKNLKQIVAAERALPWQPDDTTCMSFVFVGFAQIIIGHLIYIDLIQENIFDPYCVKLQCLELKYFACSIAFRPLQN
jgi:hypothetical protein